MRAQIFSELTPRVRSRLSQRCKQTILCPQRMVIDN